jgi:hypothetical protein
MLFCLLEREPDLQPEFSNDKSKAGFLPRKNKIIPCHVCLFFSLNRHVGKRGKCRSCWGGSNKFCLTEIGSNKFSPYKNFKICYLCFYYYFFRGAAISFRWWQRRWLFPAKKERAQPISQLMTVRLRYDASQLVSPSGRGPPVRPSENLNAERGKPGHGSRNGNLPALLPSTTRSSSPPSLTPRAHPPPAFGFVERFHSPRAVPRRTMHGPRAGLHYQLPPQPPTRKLLESAAAAAAIAIWFQRFRQDSTVTFEQIQSHSAPITPVASLSHHNAAKSSYRTIQSIHVQTKHPHHIEQFNQSMFEQNNQS